MPSIAFFIHNLSLGGAERVVYLLSQNLQHKYNIHIILLEKTGHYYELIKDQAGISIHSLKGEKNNTLRYLFRLRKLLRNIKPDVLVSFLWYPIILSNPASWFSRIPVIACERTNPEKNFLPGFRGWIWNTLLSAAYRNIQHITTNSHALKEMLIQKYPQAKTKTSVIQNSFDAPLLNIMSEQENPYSNQSEVKHLVAVGRLTEAKNYPLLITAFRDAKSLNTAILHIIGDGEDREQITQLIHQNGLENQIILHGFQTNPYPFLRYADAYVLSSAWEGFPNSLIEALYLNGHVVSTNCPTGPAEIITHMKDGILIDNKSKEQLSEAIDLILTDESLRESLYKNSRVSAGRFSLEIMVNGFEQLISITIQSHNA